jgi:hypothetical protein
MGALGGVKTWCSPILEFHQADTPAALQFTFIDEFMARSQIMMKLLCLLTA